MAGFTRNRWDKGTVLMFFVAGVSLTFALPVYLGWWNAPEWARVVNLVVAIGLYCYAIVSTLGPPVKRQIVMLLFEPSEKKK